MTTTLQQRRVPESPAPTSQTRPRRPHRIAVVDGLRLLAALAVALYHLCGDLPVAKAWEARPQDIFPGLFPIAAYGWLGVELFFMISGFVICMSCWGRTPGQFFRSRVVRLFPAYWPAVLITTTVVALWPVATHRLPIDQVIANLTMLHTPLGVSNVDTAYWTLWAEMRFYLLFGVAAVWRGLTLRRTLLFCYGWLVAAVLAGGSKLPVLAQLFQPSFAPLFVAGIAFYLIHRFGADLQLWGVVALSWALAVHNVVGRVGATAAANRQPLDARIAMLLVTVFFVVMAVIALGWTARIQWRWLTWAGALTYPFYLLHQYIGWSIIHGLSGVRPRLLVLAGVIVALLFAAWLLHRLVERPLARVLKDRLEQAAAGMRAKDAPA
ncbi:acyltransferase family protein [Actinoplanes teichomyceticus]|uniref:Peptidoglycan/LPS O-acetylase OafA/YrhL n=1 Tax=Actinoplanes teichomyceticus TaxID=1867 RepID=A0A561VRA1_ACTTI|nr:acyltransferase [Actinoplanes teichomyceticus]TWG14144.1 peptidoglycan/LPS O-acetylase OafA/YrhL [Actinoplanes teichomyceticus]GIF13296.1 acyltransferase [Actinoplanes teichomyceticus]